MKKKLSRILLFGMFLFVVSKAFVVFSAYQSISLLKEYYKSDFLLTYDWISSTLSGSISIEGIELTPYSMKKTFYIERASLHYADYFSLITQLPSLKDGRVEQLKNISIPTIRSELKGKSFKELLVGKWGQAWFSPFEIYGCGTLRQLRPEDYQNMGLNQWNSSLDISFESNNQGVDLLAVSFDQQELGRIKIVSEWPLNSINELFKSKNAEQLSLLSLDIEHQDAGLFRRLNILCNKEGIENRSNFSVNAALDWKNAMFSQGLLPNDNLVELYKKYLLQGGALSLTAKKEGGFQLLDLKELINKELLKYFQVSLNLNGQAISSAELYVDGSVLFPPEKAAKTETSFTVEDKKFEPGYKQIDLEYIGQHIERKIRVKMLNGKEFVGLLGSVTEYNLDLIQNLPGGVVNYPLMLNEIKTFEVWINQEL